MKKIILLFFLALFAGACGTSLEEKEGVETVLIDLKNPAPESKTDITSWVDTSYFALVPLYTGKDCLIGNADNITRIFVREGKLYLLDPQTRGIFIFDMDGRLVNKIQSIGGGPMEYTQISDMFVGQDGILLMDNVLKKIMVYDLQGNYRRQFRMDGWYGNEIFCLGDRIYYLNDMSEPQEGAYHLFSTDMDGGNLKKYLPFSREKLKNLRFAVSPAHKYALSAEKAYMLFTTNDTVFSVSGEQARAEFVLDFGSKNLPEEYRGEKSDQIRPLKLKERYVLGINDFKALGGRLIFNFTAGPSSLNDTYNAVYDISSGKLTHLGHLLDIAYFGDQAYGISFVSDRYFGRVQQALFVMDDVKGVSGAPKKFNDRLRRIGENLNEESNPVVYLYRLKNTK